MRILVLRKQNIWAYSAFRPLCCGKYIICNTYWKIEWSRLYRPKKQISQDDRFVAAVLRNPEVFERHQIYIYI